MTSNRPYLLRAVHAWICDNGLTPHIVVDAAKPGVQVPPQTVVDGRVVLNLAPRAVTQLEIGNDVITFMARFGGVRRAISVPVAAVQAIYARENGQGMLLAEDAPDTAAAAGLADDAVEAPAAEPTARPPLQAVPVPTVDAPDRAGSDAAAQADDDTPDRPRPKGKPSLHVVK
ncbi:MAG: ClpXP protease specificity-enhancing factor [Rhodanobacteraceae bacterium]|nr:MAG: ClpXP protease specificity-enhancing factor [Rhodanobacteraceae bacterium]